MEPGTLVAAIVAFFATAVVLSILVITARRIREWFRSRGHIKESNAKVIAFTLADRIEKELYVEVKGVFSTDSQSTRIVQGFYDPVAERLIEARAIASSQRPEQEVIDTHAAGGGLVIYT
jgi:hypothetical protein